MGEASGKGWDEADETGISWTATRERPVVMQLHDATLRLWPEHHDRSGTVQWLVEVGGTEELLGFEAGPDDSEDELRELVEIWWGAKHN